MALPEGLTKQRRQASKFWLQYRVWVISVIVLLVLGGAAGYAYRQYVGWQEAQRRSAVETAANTIAGGFEAKFREERALISRDVDAAGLMRLIESGDRRALAAAVAGIAARRPAVISARIVEPGAQQVDRTSKPPLGYAALEMIARSAATGKEAPVEVHFFGTDDQYIAMLWRITNPGGTLGGHLLVALDAARVQALLDEIQLPAGVPAGYSEVRQPVAGSRALVLAKRGRADLRQAAPAYQRPVRGAAWQIAYWGPAVVERGPSGGSLARYAGAGGLGLAIVAAIAVVIRRRRAASSPPLYDGAVARVIVGDEGEDDVLASFDAPPPSEPPLPIVEESDEMPDVDGETEPPPAEPEPVPAGPEAGEVSTPAVDAGPAEPEPRAAGMKLPESIFRAYDIRGAVGDSLTPQFTREIGRAIGSEAFDRGQQTIVVGRDGRLSGPELMDALIDGLRASGRDVIDIGQIPTPVLYFATYYLNTGSGVMVTGSHNPPQYNGFKIMLGEETLFGEHITGLRTRVLEGNLQEGAGNLQVMDLLSEYIRRVSEDIPVALGNAFKIVVDCGNGVAGGVAPKLFRALGHDVIELYCEVDGSFPNHHPDPAQPENLVDLIAAVAENDADIGFAFDGDGDRLGVVDRSGNVVWPDRLMMLYARDILARVPEAQIIFDVKCTNRLPVVIKKLGGKPLMWKTGHSFMKNKMRETGAQLAGEMSGHIFFKERWYGFDDALYAAARLLEILMGASQTPTEVLSKLPAGVSTPELRIDFAEGENHALMRRLEKAADFADAEVTTIDGVRADFADGWGLVRASNTTPSLVLRFEGNDEASLARIQGEFRSLLLGLSPDLDLPF